MTVDQFNQTTFYNGIKILYKGNEYDVLAVYFEYSSVRIKDKKLFKSINCSKIEIVKSNWNIKIAKPDSLKGYKSPNKCINYKFGQEEALLMAIDNIQINQSP